MEATRSSAASDDLLTYLYGIMLHNIHAITRFHVTGMPPLSPCPNYSTVQILPYLVITC